MTLRVGRASFLSLAFMTAGAMCNARPGATAAASVVDIPPRSPEADAGRDSTAAEGSDTGPLGEAEYSFLSEGAASFVPLITGARACGGMDAGTPRRAGSPCTDDQGVAAACGAVKSCAGYARVQCETYRNAFKPRVAQRAVECLAKLKGETCDDVCSVYLCGTPRSRWRAPTPRPKPCARRSLRKCTSVSVSECQLYLSGMNAAGRSKMEACLTNEFACTIGIDVDLCY